MLKEAGQSDSRLIPDHMLHRAPFPHICMCLNRYFDTAVAVTLDFIVSPITTDKVSNQI